MAALAALAIAVLAPTAAFAADAGLKTFVEKRCYTCHTIAARSADVEKEKASFMKATGAEAGGDEGEEKETKGGDLSDVGKKRNVEWLKTLLKEPKGYFKDDPTCQALAKKKDRKKFKGSPEEFDALVSFLMTLKQDAKQAPGFTSCLKE